MESVDIRINHFGKKNWSQPIFSFYTTRILLLSLSSQTMDWKIKEMKFLIKSEFLKNQSD
jgi:hypothetical protein